MAIFQLQNRPEIRQAIGYNLNDLILVTATTTVDTSSLIASYSLAKGGADEYNGRQLVCIDPTGSIVALEKSWVSDFSSADATVAPVFTASIATGDIFEMWNAFTHEEINDAINQAIIEVTGDALVDRMTEGDFTLSGKYTYDWLVPYAFGNDFKGLSKVEYVTEVGVAKTIHDCEVVWDELVDDEVTETADGTYNIEGNYALKIVVGAAAEANDILITDSFTALDISGCDKVELFIRSSAALTAGDVQLLLSATALGASALESLDIPATLANTGTFHSISLANPHLDTALISVGIKLITDAANTMYFDRIRAVDSTSKQYTTLSPELWYIVKGSTPQLGFTAEGLELMGANTEVRLTGYSAPDILSDDTTDVEIDPAYIIAKVTGRLLISHAKSSRLDIKDRQKLSEYWLGVADKLKPTLMNTPAMNTKWV